MKGLNQIHLILADLIIIPPPLPPCARRGGGREWNSDRFRNPAYTSSTTLNPIRWLRSSISRL